MSDLFDTCSLCGRPLSGYDTRFLPSILAYTITLISGALKKVCWFCVYEERNLNR